jgi:hypothetical protein
MGTLLDNPAFRVYAFCSAVLGVKMLASAVYTATRRQKTTGFINPEDAKTFAPHGTAVRGEAPRWPMRCVSNGTMAKISRSSLLSV